MALICRLLISCARNRQCDSAINGSSIKSPRWGDDPAGSWLSYASYAADSKSTITALNTTWVVPSLPSTPYGSNAPGWWFGIQTADGNGALIQPILAYGYTNPNGYTIFNGVFDWTDGSWHTSNEKYNVNPGDVITSSVTKDAGRNSFTMVISANGQSISTTYDILDEQSETESVAYFVLEHQPNSCSAYPTNGKCTFKDIVVEVDGEVVENPEWSAQQEQPACDSKAIVVDSSTIEFTWSS